MKGIYWKRLFRRAMAAFLATLAVWLLAVGVSAGASLRLAQTWEGDESFAAHLLEMELGDRDYARLPLALRIVAQQSPWLWANLGILEIGRAHV